MTSPTPERIMEAGRGLHARSARDLADARVALGFLERDGGTYRNAPATEWFLDRGKPSYLGGLLEMANLRLSPYWNDLTEALRTGVPQNEPRSPSALRAVRTLGRIVAPMRPEEVCP